MSETKTETEYDQLRREEDEARKVLAFAKHRTTIAYIKYMLDRMSNMELEKILPLFKDVENSKEFQNRNNKEIDVEESI